MGCASSKYAADEDKKLKKNNLKKKDKKQINNEKSNCVADETKAQGKVENGIVADTSKTTNETNATQAKPLIDENIEFIDKEDNANTGDAEKADDNGKEEVTTYQSTVVKHIEKDGDDLLKYLKQEAFETLQNLIKKNSPDDSAPNSPSTPVTTENIKSTIDGKSFSTKTFSSSVNSSDELIADIKKQMSNLFGKNKEPLLDSIIDTSIVLIGEDKCKSMDELESLLIENKKDESDFIRKLINSITGYLTAKGTDAGTLLSSIFAKSTNEGIQGVLKETERTTVKVTRTLTERVVNAKGEIVTNVIRVEEIPNDSHEFMETLAKRSEAVTKQVAEKNESVYTESQTKNEEHYVKEERFESIKERNSHQSSIEETQTLAEAKKQAEIVVNKAVSAAINRFSEESSSSSEVVQSTLRNESQEHYSSSESRVNVASEFYRKGKDAAEELVKVVDSTIKQSSCNNVESIRPVRRLPSEATIPENESEGNSVNS